MKTTPQVLLISFFLFAIGLHSSLTTIKDWLYQNENGKVIVDASITISDTTIAFLHGEILDSLSQKPIPLAKISVKRTGGWGSNHYYSDSKGITNIKIPARIYTVTISHKNFHAVNFDITLGTGHGRRYKAILVAKE